MRDTPVLPDVERNVANNPNATSWRIWRNPGICKCGLIAATDALTISHNGSLVYNFEPFRPP